MRMLRSIAPLAIASVVFLGLSSGTQAASIILGGSDPFAISVTSLGAGSVSIASAGVSGNALFGSDLGFYQIFPIAFNAGPQSGGVFPTSPNSSNFMFTAFDGDSLTGLVHWTLVEDGTPQPRFFGSISIIALAGDAGFTDNFASLSALINFTTTVMSCTPSSNCMTLDGLADMTGATATAFVSNGAVTPVPAVTAVPGPAVGAGLPGLAFAAAGLFTLLRRRKKAT